MGLWWKKVNVMPPVDEERIALFQGDGEALPKHYPILWRFSQNWQILSVASPDPFRLYFRFADGRCMQYKRLIFGGHVAVRVGPENIVFWAETGAGAMKIARMNIMIPGRFRRDTRDMWQVQDARRFANMAEFV